MKPAPLIQRVLPVAATAIVDAFIIFDAFSVAYLLRFKYNFLAAHIIDPAPVEEYLKAMVVVAYFWILLFKVFGLYELDRHRSWIDILHLVFKAVSFGTIIILSLTYFYREFSFSRLVCIYAWGLSIALFTLFRISVALFRDDRSRAGKDLRDVAVIGSRTLARFLIEKTSRQPELGYRIVGIIDTAAPDTTVPDCPYLGSLADLEQILDQKNLAGVLIAHPTIGQFDLLEIIQSCERKGVAIRMVPPTYDLLVNYRDLEEVDGIPLVKINEQEFRHFGDMVKRAMDLVLSVVLLVITSPGWILAAALIRLEDGGAIFFLQSRVGKNGALFRMWKFRTMVTDAERLLPRLVNVEALPEPVFKLDEDPRVTRIGRFLRRWSFDELPQLINVLRGDMSLVGPRPEEEGIVRMYNVWERRRLKALPGITGLQQVTCRASQSLSERVKWDILYLRKRSLLLDLWILLKTLWVVVRGKGAV